MTVFIYALKEPVSEDIRYIGKTTVDVKKRLRQHCSEARLCLQGHRKNYWLRKLLDQGQEPTIEILDEVPESEWQAWEAAYIQFYLDQGADLVNGTLGGDGMSNPSLETREKISKSQKRRFENSSPWNKGLPANPEHIQKMCDARRGKPVWNKGVRQSSEHVEKNRIAHTGLKASLETKQKIRESALKWWERKRLDNLSAGRKTVYFVKS